MGTTTINALRYAEQSDAASANVLSQNLAEDVDDKLVPSFSSTSTRDSAIPSPGNGAACYVRSTSSLGRSFQIWDGAAWRLYYPSPLVARKISDETVTSSTALQADDELFLTLEANSAYTLEIMAIMTGVVAADFKWELSWTGTMAVAVGQHALDTALAVNATAILQDTSTPTATFTVGTAGSATPTLLLVKGHVSCSGAGTLTFRWAQNTSDVTGTVLRIGSYMSLSRFT